MNQTSPEVHLKRAYGLINEVERATEQFRQRAMSHDSQIESDQPFLGGMVSTIKGSRQLRQLKSSLVNDLNLANGEIDCAVRLDPNTAIDTSDGTYGAIHLRAIICSMNGQLETIWGSSTRAKQLLSDSLQICETPWAHYMMGLLHESEYQPAVALKHFERCLEVDPDGELSVSALREASAMRNYRKRFRGNWLLFLFLLIFPFPLIFGVLYFILKWK